MDTETDGRFQCLLEAIREAKVSAAQAKIRVNLEASQSEKISLLMEYLEEVKKLQSLENELLISYLCELKQDMTELKGMVRALSVSIAGRPL
jgi:hypothetical protein